MHILRPKITVILLGCPIVRGIEQAFTEVIQCRAAMEDEVVAELDLREEQRMLVAGLLPLPCGKERSKTRQPLLAAGQQVPRGERVGELLEALGRRAFKKGISTLLKVDAVLAHSVGEPVMLIEAHPSGERTNIRPHCQIVDIEAVLNDPPVSDLKMLWGERRG